MRKFSAVFLATSLSFIYLWAQPEPGRAERHQPSYAPGEIIICFQPNVSLPPEGLFKAAGARLTNEVLVALDRVANVVQIEHLAPALPLPADRAGALRQLKRSGRPTTLEEIAAIFSEYGQDRIVTVRLAKDVDIPALTADLMRRYPHLIEFAEPNYLRTVDLRPNDQYFSSQWYMVNVKAQEAWDVTTGSSDVVVAVIDTGISPHPDLDEKRFVNPGEIPGNGIDDDSDKYIDDVSGWDFINDDNDPNDDFGHGTWVSGVAAAATNNRRDIAGVSWGSPVLMLKAGGSDGTLPSSAITRAINYAVMMSIHGVRVINMSFGGEGRSGGEWSAIRAANAAGIVCVAAAGNEGKNNDQQQHYPSGFEIQTDNVISVAATTSSDRLAGFSNFGLSVGVAAPGDNILTTSGGRNSTARLSGTSFSAPLIAGVAALIYSRFPDSTPVQVRGRIEGNVDVLSTLRGKVLSDGRVNVSRVFDEDEIPPAPITDLQVVAGPQGPVLTWTAPGDDGMEGRASFYDIRYLSQQITPNNFRYTKRLLVGLKPGVAGTTETLTLPDNFPTGRSFVLIRVLDNVGNLVESSQLEVNK
ncbi:MAG: S8 family serine peptidase [Acidobacteria bacterium]|nr:S8 family serine peptidase [Acidobacteriota bacterium]